MRKQYMLTQDEFAEVVAIAQDRTPVFKFGNYWHGTDKQHRANQFWKLLGAKYGFVWDSAKANGSNPRSFTAEALPIAPPKEVKFRAWHKELLKMLTVYIISIQRHAGQEYLKNCQGYYPDNNQVPFAFDEVEWMQFTGINDCKGKEIYDGDIVDYDFDGVINISNGTYVKFEGGAFVIHTGRFCPLVSDCDGVAVLGNIYETPGLMNLNSIP